MNNQSLKSPYKEVGLNAFIPQTLRKKKQNKLPLPSMAELDKLRTHEKVCLNCGGSGEVRIWSGYYLKRCEVCKWCDRKGKK